MSPRASKAAQTLVLRTIEELISEGREPSHKLIAERSDVCVTTVKKSLRALAEAGRLTVQTVPGHPCIYRISPEGRHTGTYPGRHTGDYPVGTQVPTPGVGTQVPTGAYQVGTQVPTGRHTGTQVPEEEEVIPTTPPPVASPRLSLAGQDAKDFASFCHAYPRTLTDEMRREALQAWTEAEPPSLQVVLDALRDTLAGEWKDREPKFYSRPGVWLSNRPWMRLRAVASVHSPSWGVDNNMKPIAWGV